MMRKCSLPFLLLLVVVAPLLLLGAGPATAACTGPGAPTTTQTKCLTAVELPAMINGKPSRPFRSFDISFVNPDRAEYYLAERSNAAIIIIDTKHLKFKRALGGFVGIKPGPPNVAVNNNISGPDGVTAHGRWLYAGDGDSTVKVFDLKSPNASALKQTISTVPLNQVNKTRVDEMALTTDGKLLLAANNAEDPPFATLFNANGDAPTSAVSIKTKILVDNAIMPKGEGLSIEQPAWDPMTKRFYTSLPQIAENPPGCKFGGPTFCEGGLLVVDPNHIAAPVAVIGAFDPATNTGVVKLSACGPNGATVGPNGNLLLGCTPQNVPTNTSTLVINGKTKNTATVNGITGSDEVWFNEGDGRYYLGASRACGKASGCPAPSDRLPGGAALGVVDGTSVLIEKIPQSQNSHSVAADSKRNLIFVPQVGPNTNPLVMVGGDTTDVGSGICGGDNGCVAVYIHDVDADNEGDNEGGDDR